MNKIAVGRSHFFAETPRIVRNIRDGVVSLCTGSVLFSDILAPLMHTTELNFGKYMALSVFVAGAVARFFGVHDEKKS